MTDTHAIRNIELSPTEPLLLEQAVGARVTVCSGKVWLTQYTDARDIVLCAGQSFDVELPTAVMSSFTDTARIAVTMPNGDAAPRARARRNGWRWPVRWDRAAQMMAGGTMRRLRLG